MRIDPKNPTPIYTQLVEKLKKEIAQGTYRFGEDFPSIRALAAELMISPNTVVKAYQILESQGIVTSQHREGFYLTAKASAICREEIERNNLQHLKKLIEQLIIQNVSDTEILSVVKKVLRKNKTRKCQRNVLKDSVYVP